VGYSQPEMFISSIGVQPGGGVEAHYKTRSAGMLYFAQTLFGTCRKRNGVSAAQTHILLRARGLQSEDLKVRKCGTDALPLPPQKKRGL